MRIHFVRHGESQANLLNEISNRGQVYGLTPKGRQQAEALARRLSSRAITRLYSSPLLRAVETMQILARRLALEYEVTDALREFDCGIMEGRRDEAAWQAWRDVTDAWVLRQEWERRIEGGESFNDLRRRFEPFIAGLIENYGDTDAQLVCVGHGGLYRLMLPMVLQDLSAQAFWDQGFKYTDSPAVEWRSGGLFYSSLD